MSSNLTETIKKLHSFRNLDEGWRFGYGGPPSENLITRAELYLRRGHTLGIEVSDVFTGSNREVQIGFYRDGHDIEITFEADGTVTFAEDKDSKQVDFVERISDVDLFKRIWTFQFPSDVMYVPSIRETSTKRKDDLQVSHLSRPKMEAESRFSTATAQLTQVEQYASTLDDSILLAQSNQASTGLYPMTLSQATA